MAKPIFIIGLPREEATKQLDEYYDSVRKSLEQKLAQYYVLVYYSNSDDMEFKCFNDADFTDIKFEELKAMIKNEIINQNPVDNIPVI